MQKSCLSKCGECNTCTAYQKWHQGYLKTTDEILLKSNVHRCRSNINKDGTKNKGKNYVGCTDNKWGKCKARFPRPLFESTKVDNDTGTIFLKKLEPWLNTFTPVLSYLFRCNTDVTSLKSGTALKAVTLYVSNYITKSALKTHVIFDTIRGTFDKHIAVVNATDKTQEAKARELMVKIVNGLTAKMELGSPMVCMYLLGHPDHYTDHNFATCHWKPYVNEIFALSHVHDYIHRPAELNDWDLYTFVSRCQRVKVSTDGDCIEGSDNEETYEVSKPATKSATKGLYHFKDGHPMAKTHKLSVCQQNKALIPNFVGGTIPRADRGDYEYYCATMLTLFKPWRSGDDLKDEVDTWNEAFKSFDFSDFQNGIMKNFQIKYECLDAHDDYSAQMKLGGENLPN
ncbi:hypothetical protein BDN72DRAFT_781161, partial [Pluteus cervinus]